MPSIQQTNGVASAARQCNAGSATALRPAVPARPFSDSQMQGEPAIGCHKAQSARAVPAAGQEAPSGRRPTLNCRRRPAAAAHLAAALVLDLDGNGAVALAALLLGHHVLAAALVVLRHPA